MKKLLALLLAVVMVLALVACSSNTAKTDENKGSTDETKEPTTQEETKDDTTATDDTKKDEETTEPSGDVIIAKIATVGPLTGDQAQYGQQAKAATEIAISHWNEKNVQADGKTVQFEIAAYDDAGKVDEAAAIAEQIVADKDIVAVASGHHASSICLVACPTYQNAGLVSITNAASHPDYAKIGSYVLRNNITDLGEARNSVQMLYRMGYHKIAIAAPETDFGVSAAENAQSCVEEVIAAGGQDFECVGAEFYTQPCDDYTPVLTNLNALNPDAVLNYGTYDQVAPFAIQKMKAGYEWDLHCVGNAHDDNLIKVGGDAVEGMCFPTLFNPLRTDAAGADYVKEFEEYTGGTVPNHIGGLTYDAANYICYIINEIGTLDHEAIMKAMHEIPMEGITGTIIFDDNNEAEKVQVVLKVEGGKFVEVPNYLTGWNDFLAELG